MSQNVSLSRNVAATLRLRKSDGQSTNLFALRMTAKNRLASSPKSLTTEYYYLLMKIECASVIRCAFAARRFRASMFAHADIYRSYKKEKKESANYDRTARQFTRKFSDRRLPRAARFRAAYLFSVRTTGKCMDNATAVFLFSHRRGDVSFNIYNYVFACVQSFAFRKREIQCAHITRLIEWCLLFCTLNESARQTETAVTR